MSAETVIPHSTQDAGKGKKASERDVAPRQTRALLAATGYRHARDWKLVPPSAPRQAALSDAAATSPYPRQIGPDQIRIQIKQGKSQLLPVKVAIIMGTATKQEANKGSEEPEPCEELKRDEREGYARTHGHGSTGERRPARRRRVMKRSRG